MTIARTIKAAKKDTDEWSVYRVHDEQQNSVSEYFYLIQNVIFLYNGPAVYVLMTNWF